MRPLWNWLKDDKNRDILKMAGAGAAAVVAALWAVVTFHAADSTAPNVTAAPGGVAAGHDISGTITMVPPAASPAPKQ